MKGRSEKENSEDGNSWILAGEIIPVVILLVLDSVLSFNKGLMFTFCIFNKSALDAGRRDGNCRVAI